MAFRRRPFAVVLTMAFFAMLCAPALARNAYVTNKFSNSVSVIDTASNVTAAPAILVGSNPFGIAITPDGSHAYVANSDTSANSPVDSVSVIGVATNSPVASVPVADGPQAIAITPDGSRAYVANYESTRVSIIDTATNSTVGSPIPQTAPIGVAITPDGSRGYVTNFGVNGTVSVIDTAANTTVGSPIPIGGGPQGIAVTPDGSRAYVTRAYQDNVAIIDTATNTVAGPLIPVGDTPQAIAIAPDGSRAYVANSGSDSVSVIDTATSTTVGSPIPVGTYPFAIAITPHGSRAYVANQDSSNVSVIDTATNSAVGGPIQVGDSPAGVAIVPDQGPTAAFSAAPRRARDSARREPDRVRGAPLRQVAFNAGGSSDPDGNIARFAWDFGDGTTLADGGPTPTHTYAGDGTYTATLTVTDNEGCSSTRVFTGQTMSCNGGDKARAERTVSFDTTGPSLKLSGKREQPLDAAVELRARVNEPATATAKGTLLVEPGKGANRSAFKAARYKLKKTTKPLAAGTKRTLKLKVPRKAGRAGKRALRDSGELTARISVTVIDAAGNASKKKRRVGLN